MDGKNDKRDPQNVEDWFTQIENKILIRGRFLSANAKIVYWALLSFQNKNTRLCNPSYTAIMERSGLGRTSVADAIAELETFHWIEKKKRFSGSTSYIIGWPVVPEFNERGERIGLASDQTQPTKAEAKRWKEFLKEKRGVGRKWSDKVKDYGKAIENQSSEEWDEDLIPF